MKFCYSFSELRKFPMLLLSWKTYSHFYCSTNLNRHQETTSCKRKFPVPTKKKMNRIAQDKKLSHSKHGGNGLVCELCGKHLTSATTFKA